MYEDLLDKRRNELRELDLAESQALRNEWGTLISELDVRHFSGLLFRFLSPIPALSDSPHADVRTLAPAFFLSAV